MQGKRRLPILCCVLASLALAACSDPGVAGKLNQWVKGKGVSVQVETITSTDILFTEVSVRNDSEKELPFAAVTPIRVTVWIKGKEKMEQEVPFTEWTRNLKPGESVKLPPVWQFPRGFLEKVQVDLGPAGPEQEIFTLSY